MALLDHTSARSRDGTSLSLHGVLHVLYSSKGS